jgi:hypothetical protein
LGLDDLDDPGDRAGLVSDLGGGSRRRRPADLERREVEVRDRELLRHLEVVAGARLRHGHLALQLLAALARSGELALGLGHAVGQPCVCALERAGQRLGHG